MGRSGRLRGALSGSYGEAQAVSGWREIYLAWASDGGEGLAVSFCEGLRGSAVSILVAAQLLDPAAPRAELMRVNYGLPKNIIQAVSRAGVTVVTFGTIMEGEGFPRNPYIDSVIARPKFVQSKLSTAILLRFRLHTHYGPGTTGPFMFLGQLLAAIRTSRVFRISSGRQMREFHHLENEAVAIRNVAASRAIGLTRVSHGCSVTPGKVAEHVPQEFGKSHLPPVGDLRDNLRENYKIVFRSEPEGNGSCHRDSVQGVTEYFESPV